jgi:hypothetical protein
MTLNNCLAEAVATGTVSRKRTQAATEEYNALKADYMRLQGMDDASAAAAARADLQASVEASARRRYNAVLNQMRVARQATQTMATVKDPGMTLTALFEPWARSGYTGKSVSTLRKAHADTAFGMMREGLETGRTNLAGFGKDHTSFLNIVRELHGQGTGDAASKHAAEGVRKGLEYLRMEFNRLGGDIGLLKNRGLPHSHDRLKLIKAGFDQWSKDIFDGLDWANIPNLKTGKMFTSEGGQPNRNVAMAFLKGIYESNITNGLNDHNPSFARGGKALYNQHAEHRVLHFKTGDDWIQYNKLYGTTDPWNALTGAVDNLANDIAQMDILGPSPRAGLEFYIQAADQRAAQLLLKNGKRGLKMEAGLKVGKLWSRAMMAHTTGETNIAVRETMAWLLSAHRAWLAASQLGRAVLSAPGDLVFLTSTSMIVGMNPVNTLSRFVRLMASSEYRAQAKEMGLMLDAVTEGMRGASRFTGERLAEGLPQRLVHVLMRSTGLAHWTDSARAAFRLENMSKLASVSHLAFDDLPGQIRTTLKTHGFTPADWDHLRDPAHLFVDPSGAKLLVPFFWLESKAPPGDPLRPQMQEIALRLMAGMEGDMEAAVPTSSLKGRAMLIHGQPGTGMGEATRSVGMYKGYPLSVLFKQYDMLSRVPGTWKAAFLMGVPAGLTVMGALRIQLGEISKGNDPQPMNDPKFWGRALITGGGLGIFGDFLNASTSRTGAGLLGTGAGPQLGFLNDVAQRFGADAANAINGKPTHVGRHVSDMFRRYMPILSSHWALSLPWDRGVADWIQQFLDPEAAKAWRAAEQKKAKEFGNRPFWRHGASVGTAINNVMTGAR